MEEREITLALKTFLSKREWTIVSVHFPGAQGGLSISTYGKTRGWVPKDVDKLNALYDDEKVILKLKSKLNLGSKIFCQKSIAYYSPTQNKTKIPTGFVVFIADNEKNFSFFCDDSVPESVKDLI